MAKISLRNRGFILTVVGIAILVWSLIQPPDNLFIVPAYLFGGVSLFIGLVNLLVFYVQKRKSIVKEDAIDYTCDECGSDIKNSVTFCPKCGVEFEEE